MSAIEFSFSIKVPLTSDCDFVTAVGLWNGKVLGDVALVGVVMLELILGSDLGKYWVGIDELADASATVAKIQALVLLIFGTLVIASKTTKENSAQSKAR